MSRSDKKRLKIYQLKGNELNEYLDNIVKAYEEACAKHPGFAPIVLNPAADLPWIQKNLMMARARLKDELSADHVVNCEWMESLEAWKLAKEAKTPEEAKKHADDFIAEANQCIATMIRYIQLARADIAAHIIEM